MIRSHCIEELKQKTYNTYTHTYTHTHKHIPGNDALTLHRRSQTENGRGESTFGHRHQKIGVRIDI